MLPINQFVGFDFVSSTRTLAYGRVRAAIAEFLFSQAVDDFQEICSFAEYCSIVARYK